jgi:hypothetical protein
MATDASGALWRSQIIARAAELRESAKLAILDQGLVFDADGQVQPGGAASGQRLSAIYAEVLAAAAAAQEHAGQPTDPWSWVRGSLVEAAWGRLHQGDVLLIELQSSEQLLGRGPEILGSVRAYLPADDTRRAALEQWWTSINAAPVRVAGQPAIAAAQQPRDVDVEHRELIATTLRAAYGSADNQHSRVRTFRNVLIGTSLAIGVLLLGLGFVGLAWPNAMSLCVPKPTSTASAASAVLICPTGERIQATNGPSGGDVFLVELVGLVGAALAGVRALSASQNVAGPYSLAIAQALLKAAAGSTTAVIGVVFLGAGIVPNVGQLPSQAAILAYAIVFGYAQQLVTGIVDKRADAVLQAASPATPAPTTT